MCCAVYLCPEAGPVSCPVEERHGSLIREAREARGFSALLQRGCSWESGPGAVPQP